jgi:uncharacterized repeat protein (TIGR01451 family)
MSGWSRRCIPTRILLAFERTRSVPPIRRTTRWGGTGRFRPTRPRCVCSYAAAMKVGAWQPGDRVTHTVHLTTGSGRSLARSTAAQLFVPDFSASTKEVSTPSVGTGTPFSYTVDLRSRTPVGGPVSFTDPLPSGLDFVPGSLSPSPGTASYDPATHTVHWSGSASQGRYGYVNLDSSYVWADTLGNGVGPAPTYTWRDIRSTGTPVVSGVDNITCDLPVGFAFPFFGDAYTTVCVDVNGLLTFGEEGRFSNEYNSCPLPNDEGGIPRIAGLWASLGVDDSVYVQTFGASPRRYTIFQWTDAHYWDEWDDFFGISSAPDTDFQIILHEDGRVQIHILRLGLSVARQSTTGLRGPNAGESITYQCDRSVTGLDDQMTVAFLPPNGVLGTPHEPISFQVRAKGETPVNSVVTNTVTIQSQQETYTRTVGVLIKSVDLSSSVKTASRSELLPGESVAYTVTLGNQGMAMAQQATISDALPEGLTYAPGSLACSSGVCNENGGLITWQGNLSPSGSLTVTYRATLSTVCQTAPH